jgi:bla regulator protein BlaR1
MTVGWILYAILIGTLVAGGARAVEEVCRLSGAPLRWMWIGSMVLTVALVGIAPYRADIPTPDLSLGDAVSVDAVLRVEEGAALHSGPLAALERVRDDVRDRLQGGIAAADRLVPARLDGALGVLWLSLSSLLAICFATAYIRVRRGMRSWPTAQLHGMRVRVAPRAGPAVVGLRRPEIVVPRWLLSLSQGEQWLVLAHEREHLRARDPLLLAAGCALAVLLPWHPASWWMLARLRLAVELDCDARVLGAGTSARAYGTLLIDLAGRCSGFRIGVPALADGSSHLERRILAMHRHIPRFALVRGGALGAFALTSLLVACEAKLPTQEQVDQLDVAAAQGAARQASLLAPGMRTQSSR